MCVMECRRRTYAKACTAASGEREHDTVVRAGGPEREAGVVTDVVGLHVRDGRAVRGQRSAQGGARRVRKDVRLTRAQSKTTAVHPQALPASTRNAADDKQRRKRTSEQDTDITRASGCSDRARAPAPPRPHDALFPPTMVSRPASGRRAAQARSISDVRLFRVDVA